MSQNGYFLTEDKGGAGGKGKNMSQECVMMGQRGGPLQKEKS